MKFLASILLALVLVLGPSPAYSDPVQTHQVCLKVELIAGEPVCVKSGVKPLDDPTIDVPPILPTIPPIIINPPDINLPPVVVNPPAGNNGGSPGGNGGNNGGQTGSGGFRPNAPQNQPDFVQNKESVMEYPNQRPDRKIVVKEPEPLIPGIDPRFPDLDVEFIGRPWEFWAALIAIALGMGYIIFYRTNADIEVDKPGKHRLQ